MKIIILLFIGLLLAIILLYLYNCNHNTIYDKKANKIEKFGADELPTSEIIILNRKYNEPIQEPDLTNILCNDTNVCFSHLRFNYPKY